MKRSPRARWLALAVTAMTVGLAGCGDDSPTSSDPPSAVTVSVVRQSGAAQVSWTTSSEADTYTVERRALGESAWSTLVSSVTDTSYTDDTIARGVTYFYRVVAANSDGSAASDFVELPTDVEILAGNITGTVTLDASLTYLLQGVVAVEDGGVLNIPAGTTILGSTTVVPSALLITQGGKINSMGTEAAPVVFTSANPEGDRRRGDWGGIALFGKSSCNFDDDPCIAEGIGRPYGGTDLDDDSGTMTYTRIEYCGYEVSFGNELNCLTMNGVGSGTELHHIQTHYGSDDGFEWFGGTVDLKYALATGISDDSFDYSTGWTGRGQFWIAQQDPDDADHGYEVDGQEFDFDALPLTIPTIYNVTLVGGGANVGADNTRGMLHRRGTGGHLFNHIVIGMNDFGLDIDQAETVARINSGDFEIRNTIIFGNAVDFSADADGIDETAIFNTVGWNNLNVDPLLAAPYNRTNPDFTPGAGSPAIGAGANPPNDGFFTTGIDYIGAVDPAGDDWYKGWTTTAQN